MKINTSVVFAAFIFTCGSVSIAQTFESAPIDASDIAEIFGISVVKVDISFEKPTFMKVLAVTKGRTSERALKDAHRDFSVKVIATPTPVEAMTSSPTMINVHANLSAQSGKRFFSASINPGINIPDDADSSYIQAGPQFNPDDLTSKAVPLNQNLLLYEYSYTVKNSDGQKIEEKLSVYVFASDQPLRNESQQGAAANP